MSIATVNEYWLNEQQKSNGLKINIQYASVIQLTIQGEPIIQFIGDSLPSMKTYPRMKHYTPAIGDRIQLIDGIITGGWRLS